MSEANGVSGFEDEVTAAARGYCPEDAALYEDNIRNLYINMKGNTGGRSVVMLDGHSDEIGFMVQFIMPNGLLRFLPIGSWAAINIPSDKVRVRNSEGKYITGVVASKPVHFMSPSENRDIPGFDKLYIDIGASSSDEVINGFKIELGAPVVPDAAFEMIDDDVMLGKAFDCRLGCCAVIETINRLNGETLDVDITGVLSSQEEIGGRGAKVAADRVKPKLAIVFEGTPGDDTFTPPHESQAVLKKGPQVRHIDKSMVTNPRFLKYARAIANKLGIPFQDAVRGGGGTNGGLIHVANCGVPTIVIGVPVRYAHSHYCFSSYSDYEHSINWAVEIIKTLNNDIIESF
jgi:putative aminopeptidase FrvX